MDTLETEDIHEKDTELINQIRSKFEKVKALFEGIKSKLPDKNKK